MILVFILCSINYRKSNSAENKRFSDSIYNRVKVDGYLKIQDCGHPLCWIFIFVLQSYRKSNSEDIT